MLYIQITLIAFTNNITILIDTIHLVAALTRGLVLYLDSSLFARTCSKHFLKELNLFEHLEIKLGSTTILIGEP